MELHHLIFGHIFHSRDRLRHTHWYLSNFVFLPFALVTHVVEKLHLYPFYLKINIIKVVLGLSMFLLHFFYFSVLPLLWLICGFLLERLCGRDDDINGRNNKTRHKIVVTQKLGLFHNEFSFMSLCLQRKDVKWREF